MRLHVLNGAYQISIDPGFWGGESNVCFGILMRVFVSLTPIEITVAPELLDYVI